MAFDAARFEQAKFAPRTQVVEVEALASFFAEGEKPEWTVRGLSATELHRAIEADKRQRDVGRIVEAIATSGDMAQSVRRALGMDAATTPGEIAKRLEMLVMGSVAPKIELPTAVKLAECFPIEFLSLTNTISELTGKGADLVKPAAASQPTTA